MRIKKATALMLVFLVAIAVLCSCKIKSKPFSSQSFIMDTTLSQKIYGKNDPSSKVYSALSEWENVFSAFKEGTQIYAINTAAGKETQVSKEAFDLVEKAIGYSRESNGVFDVSVYTLSSLWKEAIENKKLPDDTIVLDRKSKVDFSKISLDRENLSVTVPKDMGIDLGAIAKGAALNIVRDIYKENGVFGAICSIGSSAMLLFGNKDGEDFKIGLKNPLKNAEDDLFGTLAISDCMISTSGGYERYTQIDGKQYHHIVDTKTGYPAKNDIASVTVLGQDGAFCDYMSTRLFLEGYERAVELIEQDGVSAVVVTNNKKVYISKDLEERIEITDNSFERIK